MARFVAPHFVEIEGRPDMPGAVRRACAFTTAAPGHPRDGSGATHHHRCIILATAEEGERAGRAVWRTESFALGRGPEALLLAALRGTAVEDSAALAISGGEAVDAAAAAASALAVARSGVETDPGEAGPVLVAPAFVEMVCEPGLPRIWGCSFYTAEAEPPPGRRWTDLQTCVIREWPGRAGEGFTCEVATAPHAEVERMLRTGLDLRDQAGASAGQRLRRWRAPSLAAAISGCLMAALGGPALTAGGPDAVL